MNILRHFAQSIILSAFLSLGILSTPIANAQSTDVSCMLFSPITDDCDGSGTPISVQITNEDMVNIAPAGLMVSVTIDGSTFLNQATPTPLNPGEFTLLDFGPLDVLPGKHSINASVTMPGDLNPGNDMSFSTFDIAFNGLYTVGGGGDFSTLKQVVDTINAYGICGATTITLAAGHTEISSNIVLQTSSTNSVNTLTFIAADINDPPIITAGTGTGTLDGIFIIGGTDYVTLNGIAFMENPTNITPTTMMEWGIALLKESGTNGTQYCTITNCGIQLNKANNQSFGIYGANHTASSSATLTVTSIDGTNSYNDINTCLITNVYNGIKLFGYLASSPYTFYDQGNLIGKNGKVRITNFGGQVFDAAGIYCAYQNDLMISNDSIAGGDGTSGGILYGVNVGTSNNATITINSNYINVGNASTQVYGINTTSNATTGSNVLTINNNYITGLSTTSGNIYGIYSSSTPDSTSISYNTIENVSTTSTGTFYGISTGSPRASGVIADTIRNITKDASGNCYAINIGTTRIFAVDNVIDNIQKTPSYSGGVYGLYSYYADELEVFSNNKITNLSGGTTALYGIYTYTYSTSNKIINGNIISDLETSSGSVYGIYQSSGNANISSNKISSLTQTSGSNYVYGMYISTSDYINIYNNYVSELYNLTASGSNAVNGLYVNGGSLVSVLNNTVYLDASSVGVNFGTSGIYANTSPTVDMRNNLIVNNSTPAGSGITVAYRRSGTTLTSYSSVSNNNCLYAGTPGAANLIYYDGTNSDQIIDAFKTRMATRDQASVSELPPFADVSVSPYDLHLTGLIPTPMCESGGIPVTTPVAITTDYDGEVRNISTPDIGADEGDFDITAPTVAFVPADGLTDVPVSTTVMVTFDENVRKADNTTLDNSNIASVLSLTKTDLSAVAFTATWNAGSNTAIITPDAVLEPMTDYIAAATGVEDMSNNYLSGDTSATFTTGAADLTPPDVDSAIVYNGNPDQIVIYYNEPIKLVDLTGFSATVNAAPETFSGFSGSMTSTLVITLDNPVVSHDVVLVSYNDATGNVTDITGNPFASVTDAVIENRVISSEKDILTFDFTTPAMNVVFQGTNIFAMFPPATDVSALTAVFTISDYANATIAAAPQTSGVTVNDFSNPVTYTIEAEDGTTQDYLVVVNIAYPIPYSENFDVDEGNWTASGTSSNWVHGTPSKTQISAAYSTPNCWVTNLSSDYSSSQNSYLETPLFDATSLVGDLIIEFAHNFDMESGWDAGVLEYSINGGQFVRVDSLVGTGGTFDTPTSSFWYNSSSSNGPISARKWSGVSTAYTGHANGWITSSTLLDNVAGSYVSFRFHFGSDVTGVAEGWAVDDFTLREQSDEKELLTFGFASPAVTGVFSDTNVTVTVPADTDPS
ncbi:MAG: Ig-like domain-containing protein, partial [Bacteroidetes bacterium]|nr:Ig-like domain-containing protein [Bacteroidota bacterium]